MENDEQPNGNGSRKVWVDLFGNRRGLMSLPYSIIYDHGNMSLWKKIQK